jgi:prevent-host-death family protein
MTAVQVPEWESEFNRVVRRAHEDGPQILLQHGDEVAVVLDMHDYRRLTGEEPDLKAFLLTMPGTDELEFERSNERVPPVDLSE